MDKEASLLRSLGSCGTTQVEREMWKSLAPTHTQCSRLDQAAHIPYPSPVALPRSEFWVQALVPHEVLQKQPACSPLFQRGFGFK